MIAKILLIIQACAYLADAGAGSGSAEAAAAVNPGGMNGGMGADATNPGMLNTLLLNGQTQLAQLVPVSSSLLLQQPGLPVSQIAVPMGTNMAMGQQQGGLTLPVAQQPMGIPQLRAQLFQPATGGPQLFAIVPANTIGGLQLPGMQLFNPAPQLQIVPLTGGNILQQPAKGAQTAGNAPHRVKHSLPTESNPVPTSGTPESPSVHTTRPVTLATALKLPLFLPKENEPAVSESTTENMEESSGSDATVWPEMTPTGIMGSAH